MLASKLTPGEIISIVGANGAGKTTLVRTISGILHPREGKIVYDGEDITHMATYHILPGVSSTFLKVDNCFMT